MKTSELSFDQTPIHLKVGTFVTIIFMIFTVALSVIGVYQMVIENDNRLKKIEPQIEKIPVLESRLNNIDKNVQTLIDNLIKAK